MDAPILSPEMKALHESAGEAARLMKLLAHEGRLLVLCHLIGEGELSAGQLGKRVGLSQSALSQHLAKLRGDGLVAVRREAQTIFYQISDEKTARILGVLKDIYCP